jgi:hypothetical protein
MGNPCAEFEIGVWHNITAINIEDKGQPGLAVGRRHSWPAAKADFMNESSDRDVAVFTEALQVPAAERTAYLDRACAGDGGLRQRVAFQNPGRHHELV